MTAFLVDTNVLSEIVRPTPDERVLKFLARESDLWISVVSLHELAYGAARIVEAGRRHRLTSWLESIRARFNGRLIVIDEAIAHAAGRARGQALIQGHTISALDALIAASALAHSLTLATRNIRDFESLQVVLIDPWRD